jgi:hypothetical protein
MKRSKWRRISGMSGLIFLIAGLMVICQTKANASDVYVYAEGAYDDEYLDVYIYADINVPDVLSYGVRLIYEPLELTVESAEKFATQPPYTDYYNMWHMGEGPLSDNPQPDTATYSDAVIFIGATFTSANPTAGVGNAPRVFLGKVRFVPSGDFMPTAPVLNLSYARGEGTGSFKNFVQYVGGDPPGVAIDGNGLVFGSVNVAERGDANLDGNINVFDAAVVRDIFFGLASPTCYADCTGDGIINVFDAACVRDKFFGLR